jgi:hypothetical protein
VIAVLFAELHGKLSRSYSRVHERAEDLLTSTAFQLLRYVPAADGLFPTLKRTRQVRWNAGLAEVNREPPGWLSDALGRADDYAFAFWPSWGVGVGQPELVLTLLASARPLGRLVVEVKLDSGKSQLGNGDEASEDPVDPCDPDQLSRYWGRLQANAKLDEVPALGVVYLTAHAVPPLDDLQESLAREPGDWLGWLSWRDFWAVAEAMKRYLPARDLAEILAHKGLKYFDGFSPPEQPLNATRVGFWRRRWFGPPTSWRPLLAPGGFWVSSEGRQ